MLKELIIVGGGPAGHAAARAAAESGMSRILIVERDAFGGTCTNRGCIPTKFLLMRTGSIRDAVRAEIPAAWERLLKHKDALVQGLSRSIELDIVARNVEIARGSASFLSPHEIEVRTARGENNVFEGGKFILATGSEPAQLPGFRTDGNTILTSDDALQLRRLPDSLAVIGSGAVGAEYAHIFSRLGVNVSLIEAAERLFPAEDPEVDHLFRKIYERMGVAVRTGSPVAAIEKLEKGVRVLLSSGGAVEAESALVGVGRSLATSGLGCDRAGVRLGTRSEVVIDDDLCTSQPHIFAAGDVTGRMLLAHAASYMGRYAARRSCGLAFGKVPYRSIPWAIFTTPEVASVGMTEAMAKRSGVSCVTRLVPMIDNVKARIDRSTEGFFKIVIESGTGKILGGTIVGDHASDLIHIIALAVHQGMSVSDLQGFSFAHPSIAESLGDLFML
jgi:dihydrolipoamide dehydrogenase